MRPLLGSLLLSSRSSSVLETSLVRCVLQIIFSQTGTCLFNFLTVFLFNEQKFNFEEADLSFLPYGASVRLV